jgi:CheY-like chemotaxis protein
MEKSGPKRILFMDDDDDIRDIIPEMLRESGYEVQTAVNGEEAVRKYLRGIKEKRPFHVVILDLSVRGGMGGKETIEKIRDINPDVKALISSGFSHDPVVDRFEEFGFRGKVNKPYLFEELLKTINNL